MRENTQSRDRRMFKTTRSLLALAGGLLLATSTFSAVSVTHDSHVRPSAHGEPSSQQARELVPGMTIERELVGDQTHNYLVMLTAGQSLHVVADQRGIYVMLVAFGPDGQKVNQVSGPFADYGPQFITVIAETSGSYELKVCTPYPEAPAGRYEIRIETLRWATTEDKARLAAERLAIEGNRLTFTDSSEARRKAVEIYEEALKLWQIAGDLHAQAHAFNRIGWIYSLLAEARKTLDYYRQARQLYEVVGDQYGYAQMWADSGEVNMWLGELQPALDCYSRAISLYRAQGDRRMEAYALTNVGLIYAELGEKEKAIDHCRQALQIYQAMGVRPWQSRTFLTLGNIYCDLGDSVSEQRQALDYLNQALSSYRAGEDRLGEGLTLAYIGKVYSNLGQVQKALDYHNQALSLNRRLGQRQREVITLIDLGRLHAKLGEAQKAVEYYQQALPLSRSVGDQMGEAATLHGIARVECVHGNLIEARRQIETALGIIESQRTNVASPDLRASFKASKQDYYEFYVDTLMRLHQREPNNGHDAAALQASERARARSLLDMLTEARADIRQGVEPELLEQERTLQRQLNAKAERLTRLLNEKRAEEQAAALRKELGDLLTQYQGVEGQIRTSSPRYAALTQPQPLSLNEIQQQVLDENTLLLEYALGEEKSYLWAVTPTSLASFELPKRSEIESAARRLYDLFTAPSQPVKGETPRQQKHRLDQAGAEYARVAVALSKMLLEPVAAQLGTKRLLIVADEALQYVPFAALPRTEKEKGKRKKEKGKEKDVLTDEPLITGHEIVTLPSASALAVLRQELAGRVQSPKTIAVLADPVFTSDDSRVRLNMVRKKSQPQPAKPGETLVVSLDANRLRSAAEEIGLQRFNRLDQSRVEAQAIAALAPEDRRLTALDFTANRAIATSDDLKQYRIVHFATHGLLNSKHPELSGVVLSLVDERGRPQDGFLRLHDIYNLKLNADLVVLSACQTALGKHIKGEGLIGLTRGFMYAGAARVMASLWKVEDEATAELMRRFYDGMLGQGLSPAAALRAAQVSMWEGNKKRWRHPFYWAGFVLQGECK